MSGYESRRVLVTGSRTWDNFWFIRLTLERERIAAAGDLTIVHGCCLRGADAIADVWAHEMGVAVERHPANWASGKGAGFARNAEMVATRPDLCLAFIRDGSRGATHCADLAEAAGIPTRRYKA